MTRDSGFLVFYEHSKSLIETYGVWKSTPKSIIWLVSSKELAGILKKFKKISKLDTQVVWQTYVDPSAFMKWKELQPYRKRIYKFMSECITEGDFQRAKELIRQGEEQYVTTDMVTIGVALGVSVVALFESVLLTYHVDDFSQILPSLPIFRLTFGIVLVLWCAAWVVGLFERFSINWLYICEVKSRSTISSMKLMKIASVFTVLWSILFMIHGFYIRYFFNTADRDFITILTLLIFFFVFLVPLDCFYFKLRAELLNTFVQVIISPFGTVEFRQFFIADVLTSLARLMTDMYRGLCTVSSAWEDGHGPQCLGQDWVLALLSTLPIYWRLAQCCNRYYYSRDWYPHLLNAGKYASGIVVVWLFYIPILTGAGVSMAIWLLLYVLCTISMLGWDLLVDWGLFSLNTFRFRERRLYPKRYYVYAVIGDVFLRFNWILTMLPVQALETSVLSAETIQSVSCFLEIFRRAFWTLFRIENEKFSNIEKYRQVDFVPKIPNLIID